MADSSYAIALGSNQWHGRHGPPEGVVAAAVDTLAALGTVEHRSAIHITPALGPAGRDFANAAIILSTTLAPDALLAELKATERAFGRRPGRRWGPRVLDLDIILWSQGRWHSPRLTLPHPEYRQRAFVLAPLAEIAPDWRDSLSGLSVRHLLARLTAPRPAPR
jgi:2-amino-4-hydroxy-6-hydroxymethyldihydropteridine diphosphokinase